MYVQVVCVCLSLLSTCSLGKKVLAGPGIIELFWVSQTHQGAKCQGSGPTHRELHSLLTWALRSPSPVYWSQKNTRLCQVKALGQTLLWNRVTDCCVNLCDGTWWWSPCRGTIGNTLGSLLVGQKHSIAQSSGQCPHPVGAVDMEAMPIPQPSLMGPEIIRKKPEGWTMLVG